MSPWSALPRTLRYARHWVGLGRAVREVEETLEREGNFPRTVRLLRLAPHGSGPGDRRRPTWILLHGITRPGIQHPVFKRFARSLAASGAVVYVPEVPEWVQLKLAPHLTTPTVAAALERIADDPVAAPDRVGLMGFSFGAPQALITASEPAIRTRLKAVAGFGAYCDLESALRFLFTGEFEREGETLRARPDPYGRWIVAANYLTSIPGYDDADDVARALWQMAAIAGDAQVPSWDPRYDADKVRLRATVDPARRALFDRFAPLTDGDPLPADDETAAWVERLAAAIRRVEPRIDPLPHIAGLPPSVHLFHGRDDVLIPYPETERLAVALSAGSGETEGGAQGASGGRGLHVAITGLYAHSAEARGPGGLAGVREGVRFAEALTRVLGAL